MSTTQARVSAPVMEVFASIQGEGKYVGQPQSFLRLAGCPLRCVWCDTPGSWAIRPNAAATIRRDGEPPAREERWASPFRAALWIASVEPGEPRPVSITGGEPLIWPDFILALRSMLSPRRLHLETAGAHPEALARVLGSIDHVSLDLKLPNDMLPPVEFGSVESKDSSRDPSDEVSVAPISEPVPTSADEWTLARRRCLDLVKDHDACVKVVVSAAHAPRTYEVLFDDVARRAPRLPLYIAPATPVGDVEAPSLSHVIEVAEHARDLDLDVRILPQLHRAMGIA